MGRPQLAPEADPGDGYLDFVFVAENHREEMMNYLTERLQNEEAFPHVCVYKGRHMRVTWEGSEVHVDDRIWLEDQDLSIIGKQEVTLDITLESNVLEFLVP